MVISIFFFEYIYDLILHQNFKILDCVLVLYVIIKRRNTIINAHIDSLRH